MAELGYHRDLKNVNLVEGLPLFPEARGRDDYLGDTNLLGNSIFYLLRES